MIKIKNKKLKPVYCFLLSVLILLIFGFGIKLYLDYIDQKSKEILDLSEVDFITSNITLQRNGMFVVNVKEDLDEYEQKHSNNSVTYKIKGEDFYFDINILIDSKTSEKVYEIRRIVHDKHQVKAKMNLKNIEKIEFQTGNNNNATVLNLISAHDSQHFVMIENYYYFLGDDIESINFIDDHFYYVSYNKNYQRLNSVDECTDEIRKQIYGFNYNHTYYTYGKINFFGDYYQKLSTKKYTVKNYCDSLVK